MTLTEIIITLSIFAFLGASGMWIDTSMYYLELKKLEEHHMEYTIQQQQFITLSRDILIHEENP